MKTSLLISTYNRPEALSLVLESVLTQTIFPYEVIVADDGSSNDTAELIKTHQAESKPLKIVHSWQEDEGFRLAESRNKAIAKASGDYIIFIDGDVIIDKNFIKDHISFARPGNFVSGTRVLLGEEITNKLISGDKVNIGLLSNDIKNRKNIIRSKFLQKIMRSNNTKLKGIKGCNMAFYRDDCIKVNGFNNDFQGWGREDSEFVVRLFNSGVKRMNLRFGGIQFHLWHNESSQFSIERNNEILSKAINEKTIFCKNGLKNFL